MKAPIQMEQLEASGIVRRVGDGERRALFREMDKMLPHLVSLSLRPSSSEVLMPGYYRMSGLISNEVAVRAVAMAMAKAYARDCVKTLATCATSSIPWGTLVAHRMAANLILVRQYLDQRKEGIIGVPSSKRAPCVIFDDTMVTGLSMGGFHKTLHSVGFTKIVGVAVIVVVFDTLQPEFVSWLKRHHVKLSYMFRFSDYVEHLFRRGWISGEHHEILAAFCRDSMKWSQDSDLILRYKTLLEEGRFRFKGIGP